MLASFQPFTIHGEYTAIDILGQGGRGTVYKAVCLNSGSLVAVKELYPVEGESWQVNYEPLILAQLCHPAIPRMYAYFTAEDTQYLVMEYLQGQTLSRYLRDRGQMPVRKSVDIALKICDVLDYLHTQSPPVIFKDLKPGNLILQGVNTVKLVDFGIAEWLGVTSSYKGIRLGTRGFAAPEQYDLGAAIDQRADIYALGVLLYKMITGHTLVGPTEGRWEERVSVPAGLGPIIGRATQKAAERRYQGIGEVKRALIEFQAQGGEASEPDTVVFPSALSSGTNNESTLPNALLEQVRESVWRGHQAPSHRLYAFLTNPRVAVTLLTTLLAAASLALGIIGHRDALSTETPRQANSLHGPSLPVSTPTVQQSLGSAGQSSRAVAPVNQMSQSTPQAVRAGDTVKHSSVQGHHHHKKHNDG